MTSKSEQSVFSEEQVNTLQAMIAAAVKTALREVQQQQQQA